MTTVETYSVDGVVLNTFAWNIRTLSGRSGTPPVVGENRQVVGRPGASWERKDFGERTETWAMWVAGCDANGGFPVGRREQFNANLVVLKRMFGVRHRQLVLEKKVLFPDGLQTFSALGEVIDVIDPDSVAGGTLATFSVSMNLCDPFWYSEPVEATLVEGSGTVVNPGTALAQKMMLTFVGPLTFPRVTNETLGIAVRYNASLAAGESVVLDTDLFTATDNLLQNRIARVFQYGSDWWMELQPGSNTVVLDSSLGGPVGSGSVEVAFSPPHL